MANYALAEKISNQAVIIAAIVQRRILYWAV